jgi:chromate transporter
MENPIPLERSSEISPSFTEMFRVFGRIGILSFGGPAAQIALMHKELVDERDWLTEERFLGALSFCMLLPGPEAMQLATYSGWRLRGTAGGLLAGLLFVLPGAAIILALALLYIQFGTLPLAQAAFVGIKATVVLIVLQALWKLARKTLTRPLNWTLALISFICIYTLGLPFPIIVALAGLIGYLTTTNTAPTTTPPALHSRRQTTSKTLKTITLWAALWITPILLVALLDHSFYTTLSLFFSKLAVVTFGGAYAVLAYMTQTVVGDFGWLTTAQMIDALGLAETTPGPLILVTEFVGLLAGHAQGGLPVMLLAGALTLWCTFVPCFLWIFAGAPYVEWLLAQPRLAGALKAISAAVVGVILNLSIWFALHVFFGNVITTRFGALPVWSEISGTALMLSVIAAALLFALRLGMIPTLGVMAAISTAIAL